MGCLPSNGWRETSAPRLVTSDLYHQFEGSSGAFDATANYLRSGGKGRPFPRAGDRAITVTPAEGPKTSARKGVFMEPNPETNANATTNQPLSTMIAGKPSRTKSPPKKAARQAKAARRPAKPGQAKQKLVCRYCGSDDLAPSFKKRRDARCRACFKKRYGSTARSKRSRGKK